MGVDIATYRCRIGCFSGNCGKAISVLHIDARFNNELKVFGSVLFIGILLILAGIESNPGPPDVQGQFMQNQSEIDLRDATTEDVRELLRTIFRVKEKINTLTDRIWRPSYNFVQNKSEIDLRDATTEDVRELLRKIFRTGKDEANNLTDRIWRPSYNFVQNQSEIDLRDATTEDVRESLRKIFITVKEEIDTLTDRIWRPSYNFATVRHFGNTPMKTWSVGSQSKSEIVAIGHYKASLHCWPRVYKSQQLIRGLVDRCVFIENVLGLPKQPTDTYEDLQDVDIYINNNAKLDLNDLLVRRGRIEGNTILFLEVNERKMNQEPFEFRKTFCGVFLEEDGVKLVESISSTQIHLMDPMFADVLTERSQYIDSERVKLKLSSLLERIVFEILITKCNILKDLHENVIHETKRVVCTPVKDDQPRANRMSDFRDLVRKQKDNIKQLLGEMIALFNRSTLPKDTRPTVMGYEKKKISKQLKKELFCLDDTIRGCGYSYSTFNVNVESLSDEDESMKRMERIKCFLEKFDIRDVKFNIVSKSVSEYKRVGAEISVSSIGQSETFKHGTLGGFASFTKDENTASCALFSRHVALGCSHKLYTNDGGEVTELGDVIPETLEEGGYDIAAAEVHAERVPECDVRFKNLDNFPRHGKLYTIGSDFDLQDLPVHLWGSRSKPGQGIISIPELSFPGTSETYIQIADIAGVDGQGMQKLAVEGDSGAIVCADDLDDENIHVISMLMGSLTDNVPTKTSRERAYISFPVQNGVAHLQVKTGGKFSLSGIIS